MKGKVTLITLILLALVLVSCSQQAIKGAESSITKLGDIQNVKITTDQASIRAGCSNDTSVLQTSNKNDIHEVLSKVADWYAVKLPDNKIGFIPENECKPVVVDDKDTAPAPGTAEPPRQDRQGGNAGAQEEPIIPDDAEANVASLTADEKEMIRLVNEARTQNKVPVLTIDMELTNVARIKAQDMIDNNYFSHNSPTYGSPFDMLKDFGIRYVRAGENIAGNRDVQSAHNSLMNSPGHRKNILSEEYTHVGIGIKNGGSYGKMFCQMFISKPK